MSGTDRDTLVALARWAVIGEAVDEQLSAAERGRLVSELARRVHRDAHGTPMRVTTRTIYRWLAAWAHTPESGSTTSHSRQRGPATARIRTPKVHPP